MQCNAMQCTAMQCNVMQCNARCHVVRPMQWGLLVSKKDMGKLPGLIYIYTGRQVAGNGTTQEPEQTTIKRRGRQNPRTRQKNAEGTQEPPD